MRCRVPRRIWNGYTKFCVERNPWDKTLSHYYFTKKYYGLNISLDQYLEQGFECLNYQQYTDYRSRQRIIVDHIIRYENLDQALGEIFGLLGIPFAGGLTNQAKSNYLTDRKPYQEVLTSNQRQTIQETHEPEIRLLSYQF